MLEEKRNGTVLKQFQLIEMVKNRRAAVHAVIDSIKRIFFCVAIRYSFRNYPLIFIQERLAKRGVPIRQVHKRLACFASVGAVSSPAYPYFIVTFYLTFHIFRQYFKLNTMAQIAVTISASK